MRDRSEVTITDYLVPTPRRRIRLFDVFVTLALVALFYGQAVRAPAPAQPLTAVPAQAVATSPERVRLYPLPKPRLKVPKKRAYASAMVISSSRPRLATHKVKKRSFARKKAVHSTAHYDRPADEFVMEAIPPGGDENES